ncbi:VOC family protein [Jonesia quinghaiensis]|uniref:VOC family protein n=1 Tax=Jonesia quinghaiensis TaxID=262806 RepID=UPI0003FA0862|nr:VOC family protein [Jonesia quinghaiensis]
METQLFVNVPVSDLEKSKEFYTALGWTLNPHFTDENAAAVVISEHSVLMILRREFYEGFLEGTGKTLGDPRTTSLALTAFSLPSREAVDAFIARAETAGARIGVTQDYGFMYQRQFDDLDGNHFEPFWMDPAAVENGPQPAE